MSTYLPIQSVTLSSDATSVDFTNIPQDYTDLIIVSNIANNQSSTTMAVLRLQVGSESIDTGSNYSTTLLVGELSAASSGRVTNSTFTYNGEVLGTLSKASTSIIEIQDYSNTITNKTILSRHGTSSRIETNASLWRSTAGINQVKLFFSGNQFISGSTFSLYGISSGTAKALGGRVTIAGGYAYHTFTSSGIFKPLENLTNVDYLVVAGGGAGGHEYSGGGGGGGFRTSAGTSGGNSAAESKLSLTKDTIYPVVIGAGGATPGITQNFNGNRGNNSSFASIISIGGGGGGGDADPSGDYGSTGGSGGGGGLDGYGASGTTNQGFAGGSGNRIRGVSGLGGGGGGGAGSAGADSGTNYGGNGGSGIASSISGASVTYSGGGGGAFATFQTGTAGSGGSGGGGRGGDSSTSGVPVSGTANTGGGGGARTNNTSSSAGAGSGGSGIIIVRYAL